MKNNLNRNSAYATNWNNMLMLKQKTILIKTKTKIPKYSYLKTKITKNDESTEQNDLFNKKNNTKTIT